jgi:gluconokinase
MSLYSHRAVLLPTEERIREGSSAAGCHERKEGQAAVIGETTDSLLAIKPAKHTKGESAAPSAGAVRDLTQMVTILIGVAGSGKTTVGRILAARLGCEFHDADDLHSSQNREKMSRGVALSDQDRLPWLHAVRDLVQQCLAENRCAVIACSALKRAYRDLLVVDPARVTMVYLKGSQALIAERLAQRAGHFFDHRLLQSQFDVLEEPTDAIVVDISETPENIADAIRARLNP